MLRPSALVTMALLLSISAACYREKRQYREITPAEATARSERVGRLDPGPAAADIESRKRLAAPPEQTLERVSSPPESATPRFDAKNLYASNAYAIAQGKQLFTWFNCNGCHAHGGGAIGPPLMDGQWRYGGDPVKIYASIAEGRPNGMPAYGERLSATQIWQLVAYVQSLSGHVRKDAAPGRSDHMHVKQRELAKETEPAGAGPGRTE